MESALDAAEGADILMVKPAGYYLDLIPALRVHGLPVAAFQVSGEYAMIRAAAAQGWLPEREAVLETLTCIRRAGADLVITYFARQAAGGCVKSSDLFSEARNLMPGGVSSPVRAITRTRSIPRGHRGPASPRWRGRASSTAAWPTGPWSWPRPAGGPEGAGGAAFGGMGVRHPVAPRAGSGADDHWRPPRG